MNITGPEIGVGGYYTFLLNGSPVFEVPSKNLITDFGWSRLLNLTKAPVGSGQIQLGTSNTPPAASDTALSGLLASKTGLSTGTEVNGTDSVGVYRGMRYSCAFAQGAVVGNVAEVGFRVDTTDASLTSRSLVKDGSGNPAVITVTAIDQLTVNYELRYYLNMTLVNTGSVLVAGVSTTWTLMQTADDISAGFTPNINGYAPHRCAINFYGTGFSMGAVGTNPGGSPTTVTGIVPSNIVINVGAGTAQYKVSFTTAQGNTSGGVLGILITPTDDQSVPQAQRGKFKLSFSPAIPKDSTKTVAFTLTTTYIRV